MGQTISTAHKRFTNHKADSKKNKGCVKLNRALRKHGFDNFIIEAIAVTDSQSEADELERYYIQLFDSIKDGYNIREGGSCGQLSESSKKIISETNREKNRGEDNVRSKLTEEKVRQIMSMNQRGVAIRFIAEEMGVSCNTIQQALLGRTWTHITGLKRIRGLSKRIMKGQSHPASKLNEELVRQIRSEYETVHSYKELAERYGLGMSTVRDLIKRYTWAHVL